MSLFRLRTTLQEVFNIQCPFWRIFFFLRHLLNMRMIPSPVKHGQTKITQQQIHSHLKKLHVSRFPVVSNEAIQDLTVTLSLWMNMRSLSTCSTKQWVNERPQKLVLVSIPPSWKIYLETNVIARTWQGPEYKLKFYAEVTKRNRDTSGPESLKIIQSAIERYLNEKTLHSWASCSLGSFATQKKSITELQRLHPEIPSPKTTKSLSLNHRRKEFLPSLIQVTRIELSCMKETVFVLTSELLVCSLCLNEFSSHDIVLHTK